MKAKSWHSFRAKSALSTICAAVLLAPILSSCGSSGQVRLKPLFREDDETTLAHALSKVEEGYRLAPDKRFLLSISQIYELMTGNQGNESTARFKDGFWEISFQNKVIGRVSRFAGFNEWLGLLLDWSKEIEFKARPNNQGVSADEVSLIATRIDDFAPAMTLSGLARLNQSPLTSSTVDLYAQGLSILYQQDFDLLDTADMLAAKALAASVVSAKTGGKHAFESASRLAQSFGYLKDAKRLSQLFVHRKLLPGRYPPQPETPISLYLAQADEKLRAMSSENNEARYLYLMRLAENRKLNEFLEWYRRYFSDNKLMRLPAAAQYAIAFGDDHSAADQSHLKSALLNELIERPFEKRNQGADNQTSADDSQSVTGPFRGTINRLLGLIVSPDKGFFTNEQTREFYRAFAYSDFFLQVKKHSRSDGTAEEQFKRDFGINVHMPMSRLETWALGIWHSRNGKYNVSPLATQLAGEGEYGPLARALTLREIARWFPEGDPRTLHAGRIFFARADCRPRTLRLAAEIAMGPLVHPALAQTLKRATDDAQDTSLPLAQPQPSATAIDLGQSLGQLWSQGQYDKAAKTVSDYPWIVKPEEWYQAIAPRFYEALGSSPNAAVLAAQSLARRQFNSTQNIGKVFDFAAAKQNPRLAFNCAASILNTSFSGKELLYLDLASTTYGYLKASRNEHDAVVWLKDCVPPQFLNPFAIFALTHDQPELLWHFIPLEPQGMGSEDVWTCRAASHSKRKTTDDQNTLLEKHFAANSRNLIHKAGRILMDKAPTSSITDERTSGKELCDLAFFMGWNADCSGHTDEAMSWYHLSLETGMNKGLESTRAITLLRK